MEIYALAIPVFLFLMGVEYYFSRIKRKPYFNFNNSVVNISVGIFERLCNVFAAVYFYFLFRWIQTNYGLFHIPSNGWTWALLFLFTDFLWYWYHRFGHEINLFWAAHIVHHQSEDYNFTVAARITIFQALIRNIFWAFLPLLGFPVEMIAVNLMVHGVYPFFLHTQTIPKLGILEYILVTPAHHRIHHASNPVYLDKNYGDVLIIWDKIFGTFQSETEPPVYGLTKPLTSYSFLWQHFHQFLEIHACAKREQGFWNKMKVWFRRPDTLDGDVRAQLEAIYLSGKSTGNPVKRKSLRRYLVVQLSVTLLLLFIFTLFHAYIATVFQVISALLIFVTLVNCGAILEQRMWVFHLEILRLLLVLLAAGIYYPQLHFLLFSILVLLVFAFYYKSLKIIVLKYLYGPYFVNRRILDHKLNL